MSRRSRTDLTDWTIHFVHDRDPDCEAPPTLDVGTDADSVEQPRHGPAGFDEKGRPLYATVWDEDDGRYPLAPDDPAFVILKKILFDGYIRAGWSIRGGRPTIYGPRPAICFTEMPLSALARYARDRGASTRVDVYGIALPRKELFAHGGRPVIYGLSTRHEEARPGDPNWRGRARCLAASCGLGLTEQYRYVATDLPRTDWTHEREWRWPLTFDESSRVPPGLALWLAAGTMGFSRIVILVRTSAEAESIVDHLKLLHDAGRNSFDRELDRAKLRNTQVLAMEEFQRRGGTRIEDLPLRQLPRVAPPAVSDATLDRVRAALAEAQRAAREAAQAAHDRGPHDAQGRRLGPFGFAYVVTHHAHSEITQALVQLGLVEVSGSPFIGEGGYELYEATQGAQTGGIFELEEAAALAAADVLKARLGQGFWPRSRYT